MEQTASSCTHALHKPLTGLRKLEVTSMKVQV
nr:MAG TPA: histidine kinase-like protein [Caudoviricetes sp.]